MRRNLGGDSLEKGEGRHKKLPGSRRNFGATQKAASRVAGPSEAATRARRRDEGLGWLIRHKEDFDKRSSNKLSDEIFLLHFISY